MRYSLPNRFYSLDVLRGVAALSTVFWHWQHFFSLIVDQRIPFITDKQPLYDIFFLFYIHGYEAVQLFFCLSGFIFFWLYSKRISEKKVSFKNFAYLRMSRLYPLHLVTLSVVAVGQRLYYQTTDTFFVYPINDVYHYVLNLFFASHWGFQNGHSFNAPIWSVSIEVLLYGIFFIFCRVFCKNLTALIFLIIIGQCFLADYNDRVAGGITYFFSGGASFIIFEKINETGDYFKISNWLPTLVAFIWIGIVIAIFNNIAINNFHWRAQAPVYFFRYYVFFPVTILSLALLELKIGVLGKRLSFIGDISYSVYLIHFPLQLIIITITTQLDIRQKLFYSPYFLALFFCVLISISFISFRYFELPAQRYIRSKFEPSIKSC
jgi:peptidoglycan/LPS O-acetylase OafA/YrhL